ncbi:hypothetical protein NLJ89_g3797 [Agrocybe chaxingu]|uniref:Uncharacterized protein n=1 Tax=Agrocybe chaxingu TaxID=84603 RepID=A0A9W8K421_9AGAR|nr:hypothetical protein NLJ89_g3797 [Agrocybe chaxingu]
MDVLGAEEPQITEQVDVASSPEKVGDGGVGPDVIDLDSQKTKQPDKVDTQIASDPTPSDPAEPTPAISTSITPEIQDSTPTVPVLPVETPPATKPAISRPTSPRHTLTMPTLTNLAELTLHSPSSQIVGTPFATNSTRFEYPFPDSSSNPSSVSGSPPSTSSATLTNFNHSMTPGIVSGNPFSSLSSSPSASQISYPHIEPPTAGVTHPKLKAPATNPPIPPSLVKKRPKWSLGFLGRRRSSQSSAASQDRISPTTIEQIMGQKSVTPLTSPREERSKE